MTTAAPPTTMRTTCHTSSFHASAKHSIPSVPSRFSRHAPQPAASSSLPLQEASSAGGQHWTSVLGASPSPAATHAKGATGAPSSLHVHTSGATSPSKSHAEEQSELSTPC